MDASIKIAESVLADGFISSTEPVLVPGDYNTN